MPKYIVLASVAYAVRIAVRAESAAAAQAPIENGLWYERDEVSRQITDTDVVNVERAGERSISASPTNSSRAAWAALCLKKFVALTGCDHEDSLGDLLAELMHWSVVHNFDFDLALDRARGHFKAELAEDGEASACEEVSP